MTKTTEKKCTKCGEVKLLECFYKNKKAKDGLRYECKVCVTEYKKKYYQENKEVVLAYKKKHYQENKEAKLKSVKKYRQENPEAVAESNKKYYQENKEAIAGCKKRYYQENPEVGAVNSAKRRARKLNATPPWLTDRHHKDMRNLYAKSVRKSKRDGVKYHVDHIVPLRGKNVSGLHVPWNLQILTAEENLSKKNSHSDWD